VRLFIQKLRDKKQTTEQQKQAAYAISLSFESQPKKRAPILKRERTLITRYESSCDISAPVSSSISDTTDEKAHHDLSRLATEAPNHNGTEKKRWGSRYNEWRCLERSSSPDWDKLINGLAAPTASRRGRRRREKARWIFNPELRCVFSTYE
jgi:hypothetical protein